MTAPSRTRQVVSGTSDWALDNSSRIWGDHPMYLDGDFLHRTELEDTLDSHDERILQGFHPSSGNQCRGVRKGRRRSWERPAAVCLYSHVSGWKCWTPSNSFFRRIASLIDFVLSTRHSLVKAWNCSWPIFFTFLTVSTAAGPAISFVSRTIRSMLSSSKWLPSSSITLTRARTSLVNEVCTLGVWSWWQCPIASPNVGGHLGTLLWPWQLLVRQSSNAAGHLGCQWGWLLHHLIWSMLCYVHAPGRLR